MTQATVRETRTLTRAALTFNSSITPLLSETERSVSERTPSVPAPKVAPYLRLVRCVAEGGMGSVWEGWDERRKAPVAVKVPRGGDPLLAVTLRNEFRRAVRVQHPNVVALYELFSTAGTPAYSMEWVDGVPLSGIVEEEPLRALLADIVAGLGALHEAGFAHGDLKPQNVLLRGPPDARRAVLVDFGLAHRLGSDAGLVAGTPAYMAPELLDGGLPSAAGDLYALGVLIYESLTGRVPVSGPGRQQLELKRGQWFPAPAQAAPGCPVDLSALCMRLLAPDPAARPHLSAVAKELSGVAGARLRGRLVRRAVDAELRDLLVAAATVPTLTPTVLALCGPAGAGKTLLLDRELRSWPGWVLRAACAPEERVALPGLEGVADELVFLLRELRRRKVVVQETLLAKAGVLFRALAPRADAAPPTPEQRATAIDALAAVLMQVSTVRPLLVVVEDIAWAGPDSTALLARLAGQLGGVCRMLLTARDAQAVRAVVGSAAALQVVQVPLLDLAELSASLVAAPGDEEPLDLLTLRIAAEADTRGRERLRMEAESRLMALEPDLREAIYLCAVAGAPVPLRLLHRLGVSEAGARGAIAGGVLRTGSGSGGVEVGLRHPTAAGVLLPPDPPRVHRRLADVYVEEDTAFAAAAARHFAACGDVASARECWLRAGNWALGEGAFASAAECLKSARQLGAGLESLGDALGRALVGSGAIEEGASVWRETADRLGGAERVRLRGLAAGLLVATGCVTEGHETYDQLMLDIGQRPLPGNVGSLWSLLTTRELPAPLPGLPEPTAEQAAALDALWAAGMALARHEPLPGLAALARHRALAARVHAPAHHVLALAALRWSHSVVRIDRERVERHLDAVLAALPGGAAAAPQLLGPRVWGYVLGSEALEALLSARFAESAEAGRRADAAFGAEQSQSWEGRSIAINSLNARVWQIDQRALRREVDLAVEASLVVGDGTHALAAELAVGVRVTLITEGLGAATARLERALARWRRPMTAELSFRHRALRAELAFFRGDENGFEQEAGSTPLAERSFLAYPLTQAHFHWLRGRLAARRGGVGGLRALRRAIDGLRSLPGAACTGLAEALEAKEAAILGDEARSAALRARAAVTLPAEGYALIGELTHGGARAWPCPGLAPPPGVVDYIAG